MADSILSNKNLQELINKLKISDEQRKFLFSELPQMGKEERIELLNMLKKIYLLNEEEEQAIEKVKDNWQKIETN